MEARNIGVFTTPTERALARLGQALDMANPRKPAPVLACNKNQAFGPAGQAGHAALARCWLHLVHLLPVTYSEGGHLTLEASSRAGLTVSGHCARVLLNC